MKNTRNDKGKLMRVLIVIAVIAVSAMFIGEAFQGSMDSTSTASTPTINNQVSTASSVLTSPSYTGGTYYAGEVGEINHINPFEASTVCDFMLLDEIYDTPYNYFSNGTIGPWVATSYNGTSVAGRGITTIDPLTGANTTVGYIYTVHIRPGVKWQNWTPANAKDTYVYPLNQTLVGENGKAFTENITKYYNTETGENETLTAANVTMDTYYVQSADFIISWEIMVESEDYSSEYPDIVNVIPVNNLTVEYYLSEINTLFRETTLDTIILPYNVWNAHAYSSVPGLWNYSATLPASGAYNDWNMGLNPATGYAPGLVGSGPFMMYAGFGQPKGTWLASNYWQLYVNPDYFVQNVPSLSQFAPKIYSIHDSVYTSYSAAVAAESSGEIYSIIGDPAPPTFIPTESAIPSTYIYDKAGTGFGYQQINSYSANAPFNITGLRVALEYAVPKTYLASVIAEGYSIPGPDTPVPDSDPIWQASNVPYYHFDMAKAESAIDNVINATHGMLTYSSTPGKKVLWSPGATLYYKGKPVTTAIQITTASEDPLGVEGANIIAGYWDKLGISTSVKEESFSTIVANIVALSPSDPDTYSAISLGCSGWDLNPADDLVSWENSYIGAGTGAYKGTFTTFNYTGPSFVMNLTNYNVSYGSSAASNVTEKGVVNPNYTQGMAMISGKTYSGSYVDSFLNNLTNASFVETNVHYEKEILNVLQYVLADQATFENLGYTVDAIAITNSTFTGIVHDDLGLTSFWYWNFMSLHLKKPVVVVPSKALPLELKVGLITNQRVYYNGQYGNLTIQVRDQYGAAMPNTAVSVGYSPSGALLNISSVTGKTNSNGIYTFEFQIDKDNTLIYDKDYTGDIEFTVSALPSSSSEVAGLGTANISVSPYAVAYKVIKYNSTIGTSGKYNVTIEVYNPVTGKAIKGYKYTVQSLAAAVNLTNETGQQLSVVSGAITLTTPVYNSLNEPNYAMYSLTGTTGSTGMINITMSYNSTFDWTINAPDNYFNTYLYIGDFSAGAPLIGEAPYMVLGELTSSENANGFGVAQPFEIPVMIYKTGYAPANITITSASYSIGYNGTTMLKITATRDGSALSDYNITLAAQNALGANRGIFTNAKDVTGMANPNSAFGSSQIPSITVTTNSKGIAYANFTSDIYSYKMVNGIASQYKIDAFTSTRYIPFDEFEIYAMGTNAKGMNGTAYTNITSNAFTFNATTDPYLVPVTTPYLVGASYSNGDYYILSGQKYTMYINSTYNSMAGPSYKDLSFTISTDYGNLSSTSGNTGSSGSYKLTFTSKPVTTITEITMVITEKGSNQTEAYTFFVLPHKAPSYTLEYALIGVLAAIAAIFIALFFIESRKAKKVKHEE